MKTAKTWKLLLASILLLIAALAPRPARAFGGGGDPAGTSVPTAPRSTVTTATGASPTAAATTTGPASTNARRRLRRSSPTRRGE